MQDMGNLEPVGGGKPPKNPTAALWLASVLIGPPARQPQGAQTHHHHHALPPRGCCQTGAARACYSTHGTGSSSFVPPAQHTGHIISECMGYDHSPPLSSISLPNTAARFEPRAKSSCQYPRVLQGSPQTHQTTYQAPLTHRFSHSS